MFDIPQQSNVVDSVHYSCEISHLKLHAQYFRLKYQPHQ
uniref:Uncharacterized protein n=1 Tax=Myoviridae sp. ctiBE32 TaxID=2826685 RepID=A0A8S5N8C4_9CAUD|nr:MAG TPA: hypothetical protein [Myoviridae sp. ctiBE32]